MMILKPPMALMFALLAACATAILPGSASAAMSAVAVTGVNLRAGPSTGYPVVTTLPPSAALTLYGCTAGTAWCDVSWGRERGWVASSYVQVFYRGTPAVVTPVLAPVVGVAVVTFNQAYWRNYYVGRPWYGQWNVYYHTPYGAVAGCNDGRCGGAVARPGHVATGHCYDGTCTGTAISRGPAGNVWVRHGSLSR